MSTRPHFGAGPAPANLDRAGRVRLLGEFASAALSGREPTRESVLFVAGAISAWLSRGGNLERDFLQVTAKAGSHHTPAVIWQQESASSRGAQDPESGDTLQPSPSESEHEK